MRRALSILSRLAAGAALVAALVAWRLSARPIALPFLTPYLERALSSADGSLTVRLGGTEVAWDPREDRVGLRVLDVRVSGAGGEPIAQVPIVGLELSGRALLRGRVAVRTARILGPRLRLTRTSPGGFDLGTGEESTARGAFAMTSPAFGLQRVKVRGAEIVLEDHAAETEWRLHGVDIELTRTEQGIRVLLTGAGELGHAMVPMRAEGAYRSSTRDVVGTVRFEHMEPAALAVALPSAPGRDLLARIDVSLKGRIRLALDEHLRARRVRVKAVGGSAKIAAPELPARELRLRRVAVAAVLDAALGVVSLEKVSLDSGLTRLEVTGSLEGPRFDLKAAVSEIATDDVRAYWPEATAVRARRWVTSRVSGGRVRGAVVRVTGEVPPGGGVAVGALDGSFRFDGLEVRYADGMPPAIGVTGDVSFAPAAGTAHVSSGTVGGLEVTGARVALADRQGRGWRAEVAASLQGRLGSALALVRALPAGQGGALDMVAADAGGTVASHLRLELPLDRAVGAGDVDLLVSARMRDATLPRLLPGLSFATGELEAQLRRGAFDLSGQGVQEGNPVTLTWRERLGAPSSRRIDASARLDSAARAALGFDLRRWLDGPVEVRGHLEAGRDADTLDLSADLTPATLDVPVLRTQKPAGVPGDAEAHIGLAGGVVTAVDRFALRTGGTVVSGRATFARDGARLRTLDAASSFPARDAEGQPGHVILTVRPSESAHDFVVTSDDAGSLFRALGERSDAVGGRLRYAGTVDLQAPGLPFEGHLEVRDFRLATSPLLSRIATLAALFGMASELAGKGIVFEALSADVAHRRTTVRIDDGVAYGPSLTVLLSGTIEHADGTVSLRGTLVPSYYGLNTAPARIPVVGPWVTGSEREGLQGFAFDVSGPLASPRVSVDPLSSLAPGVLRDLLRRRGVR